VTVAVLLLLLAGAAVGLAFAAEPVRRGLPTALFASAAAATVLAAVGVAARSGVPLNAWLWWIAVAALLAASFGGWPVVEQVLALIPPDPDRAPPRAPLPASPWIGVFERFAFTLALLVGLPEVAAILLVVKALGVYASGSDSRPAALRVMGTLVSVSWALLCYAAWWLAAR
jgi:hypothetical protein